MAADTEKLSQGLCEQNQEVLSAHCLAGLCILKNHKGNGNIQSGSIGFHISSFDCLNDSL